MSSKHSSIPQLYRSFLRLQKNWPADPIKREYDFKTHLLTTIKKEFRRPQSTHSPVAISEGELQLHFLTSILNNTYKKKFGPSDLLLKPKEDETYYERLRLQLQMTSKA